GRVGLFGLAGPPAASERLEERCRIGVAIGDRSGLLEGGGEKLPLGIEQREKADSAGLVTFRVDLVGRFGEGGRVDAVAESFRDAAQCAQRVRDVLEAVENALPVGAAGLLERRDGGSLLGSQLAAVKERLQERRAQEGESGAAAQQAPQLRR